MIVKNVLIAFSGGLDSTTLLAHYLEQGSSVHCVFFKYGSTHEKHEYKASKNVIQYYINKGFDIEYTEIDIGSIFRLCTKSSLLKQNEKNIPFGFYADSNLKQTAVPGRNLIMASILASIAESENIRTIALGVHSGDHDLYADCTPEFIYPLNEAIEVSTNRKSVLETPFLHFSKKKIIKHGLGFVTPVPYHLTRTCYTNKKIACGKCSTCLERLEAFKQLQIKDPLKYDGRSNTKL